MQRNTYVSPGKSFNLWKIFVGEEVKIADEGQVLGTGKPLNARLGLYLWAEKNTGSSDLFRSTEPGSLWALHGIPRATDCASFQGHVSVGKRDSCSTSAVWNHTQKHAHKISPPIRQDQSFPNTRISTYVLISFFLSFFPLSPEGLHASRPDQVPLFFIKCRGRNTQKWRRFWEFASFLQIGKRHFIT